jgi:hypothetical protein
MKIKLTVGELAELNKQRPETAQDGGFQGYMVQLQYRANEDSGELEIGEEDLEKIPRYAFHYKNGGWEDRLKKIFSRTLGQNLNGMP